MVFQKVVRLNNLYHNYIRIQYQPFKNHLSSSSSRINYNNSNKPLIAWSWWWQFDTWQPLLCCKLGQCRPPFSGWISTVRVLDMVPAPHSASQSVHGPQGLTWQSTTKTKNWKGFIKLNDRSYFRCKERRKIFYKRIHLKFI